MRLDFLATVKARLGWKGLTADEYVPEGYIFLATPNIKGEGEIDFQNANYITAERYFESPEIILRQGDVLMAKDGSTLGIVNIVRHLPAPATVNGSIAVLRPKGKVESSFLFRWLSSVYVQSVVNSMKGGQGVPHLFQADIRKFSVLLPSPCEQDAIADFLDAETAKLDTLVAKKRELIEKLKEKRSALISRTVTRGLPPEAARAAGLNPNPKLKPSGIEWLGEIPEHWTIPPLYTRYTIELGKMLDESRITGDHLVSYLRNIDVQWDRINTVDLPEMDIRKDEYARYTLREGDLLVCEGGEVGRAAIFHQQDSIFGFQKALHRLRVASLSECPRFLYYTLNWAAVRGIFLAEGNPNTIPHLTGEKLRRYRFPKPPRLEQRAIADYLDRETNKIELMVAKVEEAIERLLEYRTALITAAVTGKIDVRGYARTTEAV